MVRILSLACCALLILRMAADDTIASWCRAMVRARVNFLIVLILNSVTSFSVTNADDWSQFRGPTGDGISKSPAHAFEWSEDKNIEWKVKVEGVAWSQPIITGDRVLITTVVADGQKSPRVGESGPGFSFLSARGISRAFGGGKAPDTNCQWKLLCLDVTSGELQWERLVREANPSIPIHRSNSYASETPVTDGEHVYVYVTMAGIYCFDMQGNEVWKQELPASPMQFGWGAGSSPLLGGESLYLVCDNEQQSYVVAYDKQDGRERWRVERNERSNWSTPYFWRNNKRNELVICGGKKTRSYDPATGEVLWELPASGRCATTAVGDQDLLFVGSATRTTGSSGTLSAVRAGASGDLSKDTAHSVAWSLPKAAPQLSSPILFQGCLYTLRQQGGIIACFDAATGARHYRERLPQAGGFTASAWVAGERVFCLDENGRTFVIEPGPEFKTVATNKLDGMFWSSAAIADGSLLLRSVDHLYRISTKK